MKISVLIENRKIFKSSFFSVSYFRRCFSSCLQMFLFIFIQSFLFDFLKTLPSVFFLYVRTLHAKQLTFVPAERNMAAYKAAAMAAIMIDVMASAPAYRSAGTKTKQKNSNQLLFNILNNWNPILPAKQSINDCNELLHCGDCLFLHTCCTMLMAGGAVNFCGWFLQMTNILGQHR